MLEIKGVSKKYDKVMAVDDASLTAPSGEICVLLGPNGAGKSTLMKCVIGVLKYEGAIAICGHPSKSREARSRLSYVPETPALYDLLSPWEHLEFIARAYGLQDWQERAEKLLSRFELAEHRSKAAKELSKGMKQKVSICCALLTEPDVILFDEPMIGLDPAAIRELKVVFRELRKSGATVFISTHIIDSIEEIWDTAHIMHRGRIERTIKRDNGNAVSLEELFFQVTGTEGRGAL